MLRRQRPKVGLSLLIAIALLAASCGDDDDDDDTAAGGGDFEGCLVTDEGGVDDDSFNETSFNGLKEAADELDFDADKNVLESSAESDYQPNVDSHVNSGNCDIIVTVGFLLGGATATAAEANPDQRFAIVDYDFNTENEDPANEFDNVAELVFNTNEAAFLAGYLAAGMTETGVVGTYGGRPLATVTIFMAGFESGIEQYNEENDADVKLEGWSTEANDGLFTGDFEDQSKGRDKTEQLLDEKADIIMPVAGPVGLGSVEALRAGDSDAKLIWVDSDGCVAVPDDCDLFLTSVMKNMDVVVHDTVTAAAEDNFESGLYTGTLDNDGVGLAPYHEFEEEIPDELKTRIEELQKEIEDGELEVPGAP